MLAKNTVTALTALLLKLKDYAGARELLARSTEWLDKEDTMSSRDLAAKARTAQVILSLAEGDEVRATRAYDEALGSSSMYLSTKQAKLADELLTAMRMRDPEKLAAAQRLQAATFLDGGLVRLMKGLTVGPGGKVEAASSAAGEVDDADDLVGAASDNEEEDDDIDDLL